jgi:hypothetical protein
MYGLKPVPFKLTHNHAQGKQALLHFFGVVCRGLSNTYAPIQLRSAFCAGFSTR